MNIPANKYLGSLCNNGHKYEGIGVESSLRFKNGGQCVLCVIPYRVKYNKANIEKHRARQKEYRKTERGKASAKKYRTTEKFKAYIKEYSKSEKRKEQQRKHGKTEKCRERLRKYHKTEKYIELTKKRNKIRIDNLGDGYIKGILTNNSPLSAPDIPSELVELKRIQLKAFRASRKYKRGELACQTTNSQ